MSLLAKWDGSQTQGEARGHVSISMHWNVHIGQSLLMRDRHLNIAVTPKVKLHVRYIGVVASLFFFTGIRSKGALVRTLLTIRPECPLQQGGGLIRAVQGARPAHGKLFSVEVLGMGVQTTG